ncbi:DUF883 family protein [Rhizobium sp. CFBP 8762]|uniref:glycine zipper domain-containing protein n=1 Tax=Rhizobium sp. CFBP 8762 TaxID=2775279 RepID=UPI0017843912|nr:DUF883 family protein [Rhizobium sp. CFBP 8762]MBD8553190.1 DUF883 family protein [Rhizobium sp. CFBP 8762]
MARTNNPELEGEAAEAEAQVDTARADLENQVQELRAEISRISGSVSALSSGAKAVVSKEAEILGERVKDRVREEPLQTLGIVAGVAFLMGVIMSR